MLDTNDYYHPQDPPPPLRHRGGFGWSRISLVYSLWSLMPFGWFAEPPCNLHPPLNRHRRRHHHHRHHRHHRRHRRIGWYRVVVAHVVKSRVGIGGDRCVGQRSTTDSSMLRSWWTTIPCRFDIVISDLIPY